MYVHLGVLIEIDDRAEVVVQPLKGLEALKHLDELDGAQDIRVLRGDLDDDLQVLADVNMQHLLETRHRLLGGETTEVVDEPLMNQKTSEIRFHEFELELTSAGKVLAWTIARLISAISS